jgi:hypothetical protein
MQCAHEEARRGELGCRVAENALGRGAGVNELPRRVEQDDPIGRTLDQRAKASLAAAGRLFEQPLLGHIAQHDRRAERRGVGA